MDKRMEQAADLLEKVRLKSKAFYVKATQDAAEEARAAAGQTKEAARKARDCLAMPVTKSLEKRGESHGNEKCKGNNEGHFPKSKRRGAKSCKNNQGRGR